MDWRQYGEQMASLARDLLAQESVDDTLDRVTSSATELVEGCDIAGILLLRGEEGRTLAPTDPLATECDRLQQDVGQGPCFDAARGSVPGGVYRIADLTDERQRARWPLFTPRAHDLGVAGMMGFLLFTEDGDFGALNMYSRTVGAFTEASQTAAWLLASHAAVALAGAHNRAQLEQAVATRHVIGEAMGILMVGSRLTESEAFDALRRRSQEKNVKLRAVAEHVCRTGALG
ncbi:GAF and ANTAR domain-containing protein [Actinacidiphila alni]|uniref:GAF and ANTAR domain-containing protein n=1 Tax=Actinacidiphila alni TaxID=380248 RepID=UPI0033DCC370